MTATGGVRVRRAVAQDHDAVWRLARELAVSSEPTRESFTATFTTILDQPSALLLVAEDEKEVCGYLLAHRHETFHADGPVAWGEEMVVASEHRGDGVGRSLMREAETWAIEQGCRYVALASRRAGGFYLALGFDESAVFYKRPLP